MLAVGPRHSHVRVSALRVMFVGPRGRGEWVQKLLILASGSEASAPDTHSISDVFDMLAVCDCVRASCHGRHIRMRAHARAHEHERFCGGDNYLECSRSARSHDSHVHIINASAWAHALGLKGMSQQFIMHAELKFERVYFHMRVLYFRGSLRCLV